MLAVEEQSRTEQNRRTRDRANQACLTVSIAKDEASLMAATVLQLPYLDSLVAYFSPQQLQDLLSQGSGSEIDCS